MLRRRVLKNNTAKNNKAENIPTKTMGERAVIEQIQREDAVHYAAMRRRAEVQEQDFEHRQATHTQEFEHRRLMLGLDRFHELENARMRRHIATEIKAAGNGTEEKPGGTKAEGALPSRKELGEIKPGSSVFKQVSGEWEEISDPLYLRVQWVDSDCGGFFKWENQAPKSTGRDGQAEPNGEGKADRKGKGKMRESRDDSEMDL